MDQLTFLLEEPPVNRSQLQESEAEWMMRVATWQSSLLNLLIAHAPAGWYGKTSPAYYPLTTAKISNTSYINWGNAGMGSPTEFLTLNISECPNDAVESSLSDILEIGDLPQRFYLSATACQGILRRAKKKKQTVSALTATGVGTCGADDNQGQAGHLVVRTLSPALTANYGKQADNSDTNLGPNLVITGRLAASGAGTARPAGQCNEPDFLIAFHAKQYPINGAISPALGTTTDGMGIARTTDVRRLTPRECERLMGFPDDYTLIPYRGNLAKDGPRYKVLGNSMAVPLVRWIGERIQVFERVK